MYIDYKSFTVISHLGQQKEPLPGEIMMLEENYISGMPIAASTSEKSQDLSLTAPLPPLLLTVH